MELSLDNQICEVPRYPGKGFENDWCEITRSQIKSKFMSGDNKSIRK